MKQRLDLLKLLNFGFQEVLHVADFLLPRFILIGQLLRCQPGGKSLNIIR